MSSPSQKVTNNLGMEFIYIPPGTFLMGSPLDEREVYTDKFQHEVTLTNGYYMQTTEVTQGKWKEVMGYNPANLQTCGDDCPVEQLSWYDTQQFIKKTKDFRQREEKTERWANSRA